MSIYKRKSGRYAVAIDSEDPQPFRIVEPMPAKADGRRQVNIIARFKTDGEARRELARLLKAEPGRELSVERLARGKRNVGTFKTKKEAEQAERAALDAKDRGVDVEPTTITVADLAERYVAQRRTLERCGLKTAEEYERMVRLYIEPHFRGVPVRKLRPAAVSEWVVTLMRSGGRDGKPISAKTAKHAFALLSSALRWAVRQQIIVQNVCDGAEAPTPLRSDARALAPDEVSKIIATARGTRWENFVDLALMLGARRGELLALTWDDIDFEARRVTVRASLSQTAGATAIKSTKSGRVRRIPLTTSAIEAFRRQKVLQNEDRLANGDIYQADPRRAVFTDEMGVQLSPKAATNAFARIATKAGIGTTSLHSTRHTAATHLIAGGIDVTTTAAILGHSTPTVTLSIYSHVIEGNESAAMDVLGDRLEQMRSRVVDALENVDGYRMATAADSSKKKARVTGLLMVAGTGFEPVTFGL
jgi:integrase